MIRATLLGIQYIQAPPDDATTFAPQRSDLDPALAADGVQKAVQALTRDGKLPADAIDAGGLDIAAAQSMATTVPGSQPVDLRLLDKVLQEQE